MDVPARLRGLVGKTSWKHSLGTSDKNIAAIKRADLTAHYKAVVVRLDGLLSGSEALEGRDLVDRALEILAARKGSLDPVIRAFLMLITFRARESWGGDHKREADWDSGAYLTRPPDDSRDGADELSPSIEVFDTEEEKHQFVTRLRLMEGRGWADGMVYQEVATRLLDRQSWHVVEFDLLGLLDVVGVELKLGTPKFNAAAEHFLRRLSEHEFGDWQPDIRQAVAPIVRPSPVLTSVPALTVAAQPPVTASPVGRGHPLSEVLLEWQTKSKAGRKSKDEFGSALQRFIAMYGDVPVELITKKMVTDWKNMLVRLPPQPSSELASLPLAELAAHADANGLKRLSGTTVTKYLQALRSVLAYARDEMLILTDPLATKGVSVEVGHDDRLDILPFDEDQLAHIFSQSLMTNPDIGDDEIFWFLLIGPLTGCRIEETAQLRPGNVRKEKQVSFIAIERDRIAMRKQITEEGGLQKRFKTRNTTIRNIPVHWILEEAGFLEFVEIMAERDALWLFDNLREYEKYDQRGKYMSNKIMRYLRKIGITDRENVYHSFRHSLKRELRDDEKTKEEISDLLTGHSFAESVGRKYARGAGLKTLAAAVNRVDYETVDWDKVVATGRARVARMRERYKVAP